MKTTKILSVIMAIALLLSVATMAFAEGTTGSITVSNAANGETYTLYKLFDLSYSGNNYSYTLNANWVNFFTGNGAGAAYVTVEAGTNVVTFKDGAKAADLAAAAITYAKANNNVPHVAQKTATDANLVFDNLDFGYYLVDSTMGALCALDTNAPNVTVEEKNTIPTITKQVQEDSTNAWGNQNDAAIGETVNYKATITITDDVEIITMHDTMSAGLTFDEVTQITLNGDVVANTNYNVKDGTDCTFEVVFDKDYITGLKANDQLVVEYTATVNEEAVIRGNGNINTAKITYGENSTSSQEATTTTYVWDFDVFKYTGSNEALAGATFTLTAKDGNTLKFTKNDNTYTLDAAGTVTTFTTDTTGTMKFVGLDSGEYQLTETAAPTGYNKLAAPIAVTIATDGVVTPDNQNDDKANTVLVENKTGSVLPNTGGIGTIIFYTIGGLLFVGALVLLIAKKRMSQAQ